ERLGGSNCGSLKRQPRLLGVSLRTAKTQRGNAVLLAQLRFRRLYPQRTHALISVRVLPLQPTKRSHGRLGISLCVGFPLPGGANAKSLPYRETWRARAFSSVIQCSLVFKATDH